MLVGKRGPSAFVAALLVLSEARPALAVEPRYDGEALVAGALSVAVTFTPMAVVALMSNRKADENIRAIEITLYTSSTVGLALAGTAFAFESQSAGRCTKDCKGALAAAGVGTGLGVVGFVLAGIATYQRLHPKRPRGAWVMPTPVVIDAPSGPVLGAGVTGVTF